MIKNCLACLSAMSPQAWVEVAILLGIFVLAGVSIRRIKHEKRLSIGPGICPNCFSETRDDICGVCDGHRISGDW
jgi:hypothetical protein